jgi:hypothetical protein
VELVVGPALVAPSGKMWLGSLSYRFVLRLVHALCFF